MSKPRRSPALALTGARPAVTLGCPRWPQPGELEVKWMEEVVRSGAWSWLGQHERAFCREFAAFIGAKHAIGLANGTVTMQCALQAVGVKPGDEVIVPGLTWCATAQAALDIGANVVLVDIDPETLCLDPAATRAAITPRTRALLPVHLYGCMADMDALLEIAREHKLKVVEDVAHQHGSRWRGKGAGAIGDAGSYSFQQSKVLPSGEGGAVTCNDDEIYKTVFALKQVGWTPNDVKADPFGSLVPANHYGHNYRITEFQCVVLRGGLRRIEEQTEARDEAAQYLAAKLAKLGGPLRAAKRDRRVTRQAYYAMTLHFDPAKADGVTRADYLRALRAEGIGFSTPYWPVYRTPLLNLYDEATSPVPFRDPGKIQNYRDLKLPNVERTCNDTGVMLAHVHLLGGLKYMDQIAAAVAKVNAALPAVRDYCAAHPA